MKPRNERAYLNFLSGNPTNNLSAVADELLECA